MLLKIQEEAWKDKPREVVPEFDKETRRKFFVGMKKISGTRWAAAYAVCLRLLRLKEALEIYFESQGLDELSFDASEWALIKQVAVVLHPFAEITKLVQYKKRSTAGAKLMFLSYIDHSLKSMEAGEDQDITGEEKMKIVTKISKPVAKQMVERLRVYFNFYFGDYMDEVNGECDKESSGCESLGTRINMAALYLDIRFRDLALERNTKFFKEKL